LQYFHAFLGKLVTIRPRDISLTIGLKQSIVHNINAIRQADIPMTGLSAYIADLAQRHDIAYVKTGSSALAEVITHLAGDDIKPDETEQLVIALRRANIINGQTMVTLLGRYFDEKRNS
jgi:hypothetical protein